MPTTSENRVLKDPSDVQPTSTQLSVTDIPDRSNDCARSIRRVIRYAYGVSENVSRNRREKCPGDMHAASAIAGTSSGRA